jgi:putative colanic acid biosynthesis acetyltransferase WcaF
VAAGARVYGSARVWYPRNLAMEANAVLGPGAICYSMARITIGRDAVVSQRAHLCAGTHDVDDPLFQLRAAPIVIGPKAWVAAEAFVGPGVTVHEGAVLGARGVTVQDLPAWTIWAGNPARAIRERKRF